jgi:hypothetical protein
MRSGSTSGVKRLGVLGLMMGFVTASLLLYARGAAAGSHKDG